MKSQSPAINAPRSILILMVIIAGVHVLKNIASSELARDMLVYLSFIPVRFLDSSLLPGGEVVKFLSFITYSFLHGDMSHLFVNLLSMLAFGTISAWRLGTAKFLVFCAVCSVAGALVHLMSHWGEPVPMIGASAIVSGQMAVAARFLDQKNSFSLARGVGARDLDPMSIKQMLRSRTAMIFLGIWIAINLFMGFGGGLMGGSLNSIAWEAHFGGFLAGFILFPSLDKLGSSDQ